MYHIGACLPVYCVYMFYVYMLVELVSIQHMNGLIWLVTVVLRDLDIILVCICIHSYGTIVSLAKGRLIKFQFPRVSLTNDISVP